MKEERLVLCDVSFEPKKTLLSNRNSDRGGEKKNKYLLVGVLPVFDALVG
jgi:hypothetical protein